MKKTMKTIVVFCIILALVFIIYTCFFRCENPAKMAISSFEAYRMVKEEGYYIIYPQKTLLEESVTYYYDDGETKGEVLLVGKNPFRMHGNNGNQSIFCGAAGNKFLVKGEKIEKYKKIRKETVLHVEEWEIIAPVMRSYADEYSHRFCYPINCIDAYDIEKGDYISDTIGEQTLYWWEVEYYLNEEEDYYLVSPKKEGDTIAWYLCVDGIPDVKEELTDKVTLTGNVPEQKQYESILEEDISNGRHYRNFILVNGKKEKDSIQVTEWKLAGEINREHTETNDWHSAYFLDERD